MKHRHLDEHGHVLGAIDDTRGRTVLSTRHRMIELQARERRINVVGSLMRDAHGAVIGGFSVEVTPAESAYHERVTQISEKRAVIEQAEGTLAMTYGLKGDAGFNRNRATWPKTLCSSSMA